ASLDIVAAGNAAPAQFPTVQITSGAASATLTISTPSDPWLRVSNVSAVSPLTINVGYDATGLEPGLYTSSITISASGATPVTVPIRVRVVRVVNAASFAEGPISPGEIVTITGTGLGPDSAVGVHLDSDGKVGTDAAGMRVLFNGVAAPLVYV